jgi:2-polyprenyl-6-methoxyphenol hydroxylase-like FAD-dependent oxidoreductase
MSDVLVVGAGPTGLTLACCLAQRGVDVRLIDAAPAPPTGSRGKGLTPRTLEVCDDLGVVEQIIAHGFFGMPVRFYDESGQARKEELHRGGTARPDRPYATTMVTPQWRVEETLRNRLRALGREVQYGHELTGLTQDANGVEATVATAGGLISMRARFMVGCDGGKSTARHVADIPFLGETIEEYRMLVMDVQVQGLDRAHWHIWRSASGFLALCPLPSTEFYQLQISVAPGQETEPSQEAVQAIMEQRTGRQHVRLLNTAWSSLWRANVRMVERYREGRLFLAGDAAHVHSPAGGQGMNTGIQDAYNLGWKLAAVLGGASAALLDTYQEERLPVAAWVLGVSNKLMNATVTTGTITFSRDEETLQLGINYRHSSLTQETRAGGDGLRAGDRAPEAPGLRGPEGSCTMFDLLRGPHATVIALGPHWQPVLDRALAKRDTVRGYVIDSQPGPGVFVDAEGHAAQAYGSDTLYLVRPDNYVGYATSDPDAPGLEDYLQSIMPANRETFTTSS